MQYTCGALAKKLRLTWIQADVILKLLQKQGKATVVSLSSPKRGRPSIVWELPEKIVLEFDLA